MYADLNNESRAWLQKEIKERGIPVSPDAKPCEVIPWALQFITRHNELESTIPINTEGRRYWQAAMDDWQTFLKKLEELDEQLEKVAKTASMPPPQPLPNLPTSCQKLPKVANTLPDVATTLPKPCQTLPQNATPPAFSPSPSVKNPQSTDPEPTFDELELADVLDGFKTDRERLAAASDEMKALLAGEPVRFARLTSQQQTAIFALLDSGYSARAVARMLAQPPPIGAAIKVSKTAVNEWRKKHQSQIIAEKNRQKAEAQRKAAEAVVDHSENAEAAFQKASERLLKLRILTSEDAPLDQMEQLIKSLTTLRKQTLAERKQAHAEKTKSNPHRVTAAPDAAAATAPPRSP